MPNPNGEVEPLDVIAEANAVLMAVQRGEDWWAEADRMKAIMPDGYGAKLDELLHAKFSESNAEVIDLSVLEPKPEIG